MDNSFKTFLQSSANHVVKQVPVKIVTESNNGFGPGPTDRIGFLKEKTEMFCKKFGEFGMDSLDTFFKESVEKLLNLKTESVVTNNIIQNQPVINTKPMSTLERANALMEDVNPKPSLSLNQNPAGNDMMARASMMLA